MNRHRAAFLSRTFGLGLAALLATEGLLGCSAATRNVRAFRAYAHESANLTVCADRIEDLAAILELTDRMLTRVAYTPGDKWVKALPLEDAEADKIKDDLRKSGPYANVEFEIPTIKLYRVHLERVLEEQKKLRPSDEGQFPSLLDAASTLAASSKDLKELWGKVREAEEAQATAIEAREQAIAEHPPRQGQTTEAPEVTEARHAVSEASKSVAAAKAEFQKSVQAVKSVDASNPDKHQILSDELTAASVAYRLDLEALALIPIVVVQTVRSIPSAPKDLAQSSDGDAAVKSVSQLVSLPWKAEAIEERLGGQIKVMEEMTSSLAQIMKVEVEKTAGFGMKQSIVDQVVGITLDSFHANLHAGGEMFFYNQVGGSDPNSTTTTRDADGNSKTVTMNFTGRTHRLNYDVNPIVLLRANLAFGLDWIHLPNAANFNLGYSTDRVFSSGGNIEESGSLGKELGLSGFASDVLDAGLGIVGVKTNVKVATFTAGTVTQLGVDPTTGKDTGAVIGKTALQLAYKQIDAGYDISFLLPELAGRAYIEEFTLGFRYMDYALPRILYQLKDTSGQGDNYAFERESPPQTQRSQYYMGGLIWRFGPGGTQPGFSAFADLGIFMGSGPAAYTLCKTTVDTCDQREDFESSVFVGDLSIGAGLRFRLTPRKSRLRLLAEAQYHGEIVYTSIFGGTSDPNDKAQRTVEFGGQDIFHGPRLSLVGSL